MKKILFISMMLTGLLMPFSVFSDDGGSAGYTEDSTDVAPPTDLTEQATNGYVLSSGTYTVYCKPGGTKWKTNCDNTVSNTQCPVGYSPRATVSPVWNTYRAADVLRGYFLSPSASAPSGPWVPTNNGAGGYELHFATAYADFVGAEDEYITINYSVYCLPNP